MKEEKDISDLTVLVLDRGTFFPVAKRLARDVKTCYYAMPKGEASETFAQFCRGNFHGDVTRISSDEIWQVKPALDLIVVPDCDDGWFQLEMESQGYPVWGSKLSSNEETKRGVWLNTAKDLGLPMPKTHIIQGLTNLKLFVAEHEGEVFHCKISRFRGDCETFKIEDPSAFRNKCDVLAMKFGPWQDKIKFYVQEPVETDIEGGCDTYFVAGKYPDKVVLGYEKKGEGYFATWKERGDMAPEIWTPNEIIAPLLEAYGYCNLVSTEIRVTEDKSFLLDPCLRFGSPAGEEELELYDNFTEIVYRGARGELVQPKMSAQFCGEAIISYCGDKEGWKSITVPNEVEQWVKLYACGYEYGAYHFPPSQDAECIGCAVALGDTPEEVLDKLKEIREALSGSAVDLKIESLADLFKEIDEADKQGIPFHEKGVPEPAAVLE